MWATLGSPFIVPAKSYWGLFAVARHCVMTIEEYEELGLADAMMLRGSRLRKLRELADADARAREVEEVSGQQDQQYDDIIALDDGKCVLRYDSYLAHQRYYDDLKHSNCDYIDYSGLVLQQDKSLGKGGICWDAAFILAEHLISTGNSISMEDTIVELGAGTGLCGLLIAKAVACHVEITDLPHLLPLMQRNVGLNFGTVQDLSKNDQEVLYGSETICVKGTCEARILEWGRQPTDSKKYNIILGADVVASLYDPVALAETIHQLSMPDAIVYISYKGRLDGPHETFEQRMQELYKDVQSRIAPLSRNKNPGVYILRAKGPRIR
jgi:predicted nicotinamide N-methyase